MEGDDEGVEHDQFSETDFSSNQINSVAGGIGQGSSSQHFEKPPDAFSTPHGGVNIDTPTSSSSSTLTLSRITRSKKKTVVLNPVPQAALPASELGFDTQSLSKIEYMPRFAGIRGRRGTHTNFAVRVIRDSIVQTEFIDDELGALIKLALYWCAKDLNHKNMGAEVCASLILR